MSKETDESDLSFLDSDDEALLTVIPKLEHAGRIKSGHAKRRYERLLEDRHLKAMLDDDYLS